MYIHHTGEHSRFYVLSGEGVDKMAASLTGVRQTDGSDVIVGVASCLTSVTTDSGLIRLLCGTPGLAPRTPRLIQRGARMNLSSKALRL